jgi:hypothetical protein
MTNLAAAARQQFFPFRIGPQAVGWIIMNCQKEWQPILPGRFVRREGIPARMRDAMNGGHAVLLDDVV